MRFFEFALPVGGQIIEDVLLVMREDFSRLEPGALLAFPRIQLNPVVLLQSHSHHLTAMLGGNQILLPVGIVDRGNDSAYHLKRDELGRNDIKVLNNHHLRGEEFGRKKTRQLSQKWR